MEHSSARQSLRRLQILRLIEIGGQCAAIGVAVLGLGMDLPLGPLFTVVGALAVLALFTWLRLHAGGPVTEPELFVQLVIDVAALSFLLYFTGGAANPFVSAYLLPLSVAAAVLTAPFAWTLTGLTVIAHTVLLVAYVPLPGVEDPMPLSTLPAGEGHALHIAGAPNPFGLHVLGMWLNFMISAVLITFFVQRFAHSLQSRERELAAAREEALRNERLVALGTLAAGTAHELGTPLATVAVVAKDLKDEFADDPELAPQLELIRSQVAQCKAVLQRLVDSVAPMQAGTRRTVELEPYLETVAERWRLLWPATPLQLTLAAPATHVVVDGTLEQALLALLNNAAKVSPGGITLEARTHEGQAVLRILDDGPGLPREVIESAGRRFLREGSRDGMGVGLFLANATIERLGGRVSLHNRPEGGGLTEVRLPLVGAERRD